MVRLSVAHGAMNNRKTGCSRHDAQVLVVECTSGAALGEPSQHKRDLRSPLTLIRCRQWNRMRIPPLGSLIGEPNIPRAFIWSSCSGSFLCQRSQVGRRFKALRARSSGEIASDCNALTRSSSRSASGSNGLCVAANTTGSCGSVSTSSTL